MSREFEATRLRLESLWREGQSLRQRLEASRRDFTESLMILRVTVDEIQKERNATPQEEQSSHPALNVLSPRECEVLRLIAESHSTKEIAHLLGIAFRTAVNHRSHIMAKLGIHDVAGLTRCAMDSGLIRTMHAHW